MLLRRFRHVNYNFPTLLHMNQPYVTGLKLKNSLTSELVLLDLSAGRVCAHFWQHRQMVYMRPHRLLT